MKNIAIIPARGGSKGIPNKNMIKIHGKPLISYTLEVAVSVKNLSEVIVSSDSDNILNFCKENFPKVKIHKRSKFLSSDVSPVKDTVKEVLKNRSSVDLVILLQPTSPLRTTQNIENAIKIFHKKQYINSLVSVCEMDDLHPARMYWSKDNILEPIMEEFQHFRRQEIPKAYYRNGSIYITRAKAFNEERNIIVKPVYGYIMKRSQLLNIDEPIDIKYAEFLIKKG